MPTYNYRCDNCDVVHIESFPIANRPDSVGCPLCGESAHYEIAAVAFTKASYVDGHKRKGWADFKEANKLVREAAVSKKDTAREIRKEIKKMGVKVEK